LFETTFELYYLQLAARSRTAYRLDHHNEPWKNDEYLVTIAPATSGLYTNDHWLNQWDMLLTEFVDQAFEYAPVADRSKVPEDIEKVAEFAGNLILANQVFEGSQDRAAIERFANRRSA
jgi:hypothetical protein